MAIELASLEVPIQLTGGTAAAAQLAALDVAGAQAATGLNALPTAAAVATTSLTTLSGRGIRLVESGLMAMTVAASGVPGPLARISQGALLLGGGKGALLLAAIAAGVLTVAWQALTKASDEMDESIKNLKKTLSDNDQSAEDLARGWKKYGDEVRLAAQMQKTLDDLIANKGPALTIKFYQGEIARLQASAAALHAVLVAASAVIPIGGAGKPPDVVPTPEKIRLSADALDWWTNQAYTTESAMRSLHEQAAKLNDAFVETAVNADLVQVAIASMKNPFDEAAEAAKKLEAAQKQMADNLSAAVTGAFAGIAASIGAALAGQGNIGDMMVGVLGQAFQQFGAALIVGATIINKALAALATHPWAAIGLGAALVAVGSMLSAKANQAFGSGYGTSASGTGGGYGLPPWSDAGVTRTVPSGASPGGGGAAARASALQPAQAVQQFFTIIGPNDPSVQRQVKLAYEGAVRRGV